jgi:hypothetical protein
MRIPLVRFGSDPTPIAEWEWKWLPVVVPVVIVLLLVLLPLFVILGMILGYATLLVYCLVGVFLPRRARKEWFAQLSGGILPSEEIERHSNGVTQVPEEDRTR